MTANVLVTEGGIKALESENIGNAKDSWRNSTNTDCFNSETRRKNVTCTDSFASGENLEKCDSS